MHYICFESHVGRLWLVQEGESITHLEFSWAPPPSAVQEGTPLLQEAHEQLTAYFAGKLQSFSLPLAPKGTLFQKAVWNALCEIPYGQTRSYADIARAIGRPNAARAVGGANHVNPISILIPCHRVIGASGNLVGYGGGLSIKEKLLKLERRTLRNA